MGAMPSYISGASIVYSTVCSGADQRKRYSSTSLAFVGGIHRWPVNSPHKGPVTRKMFPFDDVIMVYNISTIIIMPHPGYFRFSPKSWQSTLNSDLRVVFCELLISDFRSATVTAVTLDRIVMPPDCMLLYIESDFMKKRLSKICYRFINIYQDVFFAYNT